jgi:hypothetical protein
MMRLDRSASLNGSLQGAHPTLHQQKQDVKYQAAV